MKGKEIYMYALGGLILVGIILITIFFLYKEMPQTNKDIMLIIIGAWVAKFSDVVAYFFGSSKGSADKNEMLYNSTPPDTTNNNNPT